MASRRILLTKRTMGASSTSSRPSASALGSSSPPETSRFSRSRSSSVKDGIAASAWSMAFVTAVCSLSSSTTTNSMLIEVWKRISSRACRLVGSATARKRRLPRFIRGRTRCFCRSFSLTARTASISSGDGVEIEERHAELVRGRNGDVAGGRQVRGHQIGHQVGAFFLRLGDGVAHRGLVQEAILDQPMREPTERGAIGAADRYCVVIHGLRRHPRI